MVRGTPATRPVWVAHYPLCELIVLGGLFSMRCSVVAGDLWFDAFGLIGMEGEP